MYVFYIKRYHADTNKTIEAEKLLDVKEKREEKQKSMNLKYRLLNNNVKTLEKKYAKIN